MPLSFQILYMLIKDGLLICSVSGNRVSDQSMLLGLAEDKRCLDLIQATSPNPSEKSRCFEWTRLIPNPDLSAFLSIRYAAAVARHHVPCAAPSVRPSNHQPPRGSCTHYSTSWPALSHASCCLRPCQRQWGRM